MSAKGSSCLACKNAISHAGHASLNHGKTCHAGERITVCSPFFPFLHHKFPDPDRFAMHSDGLDREELEEMLQRLAEMKLAVKNNSADLDYNSFPEKV